MKTNLIPTYQTAHWGQEIDGILRNCVHCGFCTAVCPTYQLLGNELDSPRGRIYLIKSALEGNPIGRETQYHLDLCLTCRACEATCPSGVKYGHLLEIGRHLIESQVPRPWKERFFRWSLRQILPYSRRFAFLLNTSRLLRILLPNHLKKQFPAISKTTKITVQTTHSRTVLLLAGCVQSVLAPRINQAATQILNKLGISVQYTTNVGCCGAVNYHLAAHDVALKQVKTNIDAWWTTMQQVNVENIVMTASGCGVFVKEYGYLLQSETEYAEKAAHIAAIVRDLSEILLQSDLSQLKLKMPLPTIAVHAPCTLQHGQQLAGQLEILLSRLGFSLTTTPDNHLCCGSAGTYSLLQPDVSQQLLQQKIENLQMAQPEFIVTANIGCLNHLQTATIIPVKHWAELVTDYFEEN